MSEINPVSTAGDKTGSLGLYVHVPFCASTCDFCAFYQTAPTVDGISRYMQGITDEAGLVEWGGRSVETVFWGGGTPGLLAPKDILTLGGIVRTRLNGAAKEWTVEMAPASVTQARLAALKEIGVTRISMGAQSFQPELLEGLGRQHTREQIFRAYERIREADFASVNIDMMFALPGQDEAAWLNDLGEALALAPDHLSTYCLTFEEDTKLWVKLSKGQVKLDVEHEARLYETTWARLEAAGYGQYEVSNFARSGHACLHNLNTWRMQEWVGLGPSAASQHAGIRGGNVADLAKWHAHLAHRERVTEDRVVLTPSLLAEDALVFGVRMNAGVNLTELRDRFPSAPWSSVEFQVNRLQVAGVAEVNNGHLRLTPRGRIIADAVGAEIMDAFEAVATK